jgi:O-antigen/teichoic acid export membrane protein
MAGLVFVFLNFPLGALLNGCDRHILNMYLVGAIMVVNVALNAFAIPRFSFVGAAAAFVVSHALLFVVSMIAGARIVTYSKRKTLFAAGQALFSAAVMAGVILMLSAKLHFILLIIIGAIVYGAMIFLTRGLTFEEIKYYFDNIFRKSANRSNEI